MKTDILHKIHDGSIHNPETLGNKPYHKNDNQNNISEINDRCIIIKIYQKTIDKNKGSVYEAVRQCWKNRISRVEQADYVLAVVKGLIRGVYKPTKWYYSYPKEDCSQCKKESLCKINSRIAFIGDEAEKDIQVKYLNKFVPDFYVRPGPGPFLYVNI